MKLEPMPVCHIMALPYPARGHINPMMNFCIYTSIFQSSNKRETSTMKLEPMPVCHIMALPYPARGHINPMMNFCILLSLRKPDILITFVVTEEWHGFIGSDPKPDNIRFSTLPNVIPSELVRAKDFPGFVEAVNTKLESRERDLQQPVNVIVADPFLVWSVRVGNGRNIPVAAFWPMSASVFTVFYHFELLKQNGHFPVDVSERGDEVIDYIPGISTARIADLPTLFYGDDFQLLDRAMEAISSMYKAQYILSASIYELESQLFDILKAKLPIPVYPIGPTIPYFKLSESSSIPQDGVNYLRWLDSQPRTSVLYISMGSFLSVSQTQMDEIVFGMRNSGVRFLWSARGDASSLKESVGDMGLVVPWCDQLRVLCHDSIGGFWSHCGWSSTIEAVYAGLPVLTCPIFWDQVPNSRQIVDDWKIGYRVKKNVGAEHLVTGEEIARLVRRFMDLESNEGKKMRERAKQLQKTCQEAIAKGGSLDTNLDAFIKDISQGHHH